MTSQLHALPEEIWDEIRDDVEELKEKWKGGPQHDNYFAKKVLLNQLKKMTRTVVQQHLGIEIPPDSDDKPQYWWFRSQQRTGNLKSIYIWGVSERYKGKLSAFQERVVQDTFGFHGPVIHWQLLNLYRALEMVRKGIMVPYKTDWKPRNPEDPEENDGMDDSISSSTAGQKRSADDIPADAGNAEKWRTRTRSDGVIERVSIRSETLARGERCTSRDKPDMLPEEPTGSGSITAL